MALQAIREAARCIELQARLTGEIDDSVTLNVTLAPALIQLQTIVLQALAPHPAARAAVVAALAQLGNGPALIEHDG